MDLLQRFASAWCGTAEAGDTYLVSAKLLEGLSFPEGEELLVTTRLLGGRSLDPLHSLCYSSLIYPRQCMADILRKLIARSLPAQLLLSQGAD